MYACMHEAYVHRNKFKFFIFYFPHFVFPIFEIDDTQAQAHTSKCKTMGHDDPKVVSFPSDPYSHTRTRIHPRECIQIYKFYTIEKCNQQFHRDKQTNSDFKCSKVKKKHNNKT